MKPDAPLTTRRYGARALLVECPGRVAAVHVLARRHCPDATDIVPAASTVLIDGVGDPEGLAAEISSWRVGDAPVPAGDVVELPVHYDGPDLADVARQWGVDTAEAVRLHTGCEFRVEFCGFAPGFAYCSGLPAELAMSRLDSPRSRVPAGSVGLAGAWTGVYPTASPGGWRLIGRTDTALWRPDHDPPALLVPGTRVRFVDA